MVFRRQLRLSWGVIGNFGCDFAQEKFLEQIEDGGGGDADARIFESQARAAAIVSRLVREGKLVETSRPDKNRKMKTFLSVADNNKLLPDDLFE